VHTGDLFLIKNFTMDLDKTFGTGTVRTVQVRYLLTKKFKKKVSFFKC